jgi:hypothetical protein
LLGVDSSTEKSPPAQTLVKDPAITKPENSQPAIPMPERKQVELAQVKAPSASVEHLASHSSAEEWHQLLPNLALTGMTAEFARHCLLSAKDAEMLSIDLDKPGEHLHADATEQELKQALQKHYGQELTLKITLTNIREETPAKRAKRLVAERQQQAELEIANDAFVNHLKTAYNAQIVKHSVKPR